MKQNVNNQSAIEKFRDTPRKAMQKLQDLGAKVLAEPDSRRTLYVPGNVNLNAPTPVDLYGAHIAMRSHSHKSFLRKHNLGKFKKGKQTQVLQSKC